MDRRTRTADARRGSRRGRRRRLPRHARLRDGAGREAAAGARRRRRRRRPGRGGAGARRRSHHPPGERPGRPRDADADAGGRSHADRRRDQVLHGDGRPAARRRAQARPRRHRRALAPRRHLQRRGRSASAGCSTTRAGSTTTRANRPSWPRTCRATSRTSSTSAPGVQVAADHGPLFAPGTGLSYSNSNYSLLALIVEAATGHSFAAELRTRLFEPLRLRNTSFPMSSQIDGPHTHGYLFLDDGPFDVTDWSPTLFGPAGAILSNADDLARFYRALLQGRLLAAEVAAGDADDRPRRHRRDPDAGILGGGWGLGLLREHFPCGVAWGHDAENPGYMTAAWSSTERAPPGRGRRQQQPRPRRAGEPRDARAAHHGVLLARNRRPPSKP